MEAQPVLEGGPGEGRLSRVLVAWVGAVCRRARLVVLSTAVVTLVALVYALLQLGINTNHTALLSDDLPFWQEYRAYAEVFPILDEALLVVIDAQTPSQARRGADALAARLRGQSDRFRGVYVPGGGEFFERHALLYLDVEELDELSDHLAGLQPILAELARDRSLRNLSKLIREGVAYAEREGVVFADLSAVFDSLSNAAAAVLEGNPRPVSWTDLLVRRSITGDVARRVIVLDPVFDYDKVLPGTVPMRIVREAARDLGLTPERGVVVRITGNVALITEEMITVVRSGIGAALASFALVAGILYAAVRSPRIAAAVLVTLFEGLIWTAAFAAVAVGHVNVVSVAFAVLFIGLGVDFGIHLGMRYAELVRAGSDGVSALCETAGSVGGSLVFCALTTAVGFYVFVPTDYRAVAELGLISGTGMLISLFCSLTVLPALLVLGAQREVGQPWVGARAFERVLGAISLGRPGAVRAGAALLAVGSLALMPRARFDHNVVAMRDPSTESARTFDELLAESNTSPWSIDLIARDLDAAEAAAARLRRLDVVERAVTLRDYVPGEQEEKLEILQDLAFFLPEPTSYGGKTRPPVGDQIASLRALQETLEGSWIADGSTARAASARRAAAYLERFLARLETLEGVEQAVESLEESLTGELPDQMRTLWLALGPGAVTLEDLPRDLAARMVAPDGRARVEVLPAEDLGDNDAHARFVDTVRAQFPDATGSAVSLLEWARAVVRTFRQALVTALGLVALVLFSMWRKLSDTALVLAPLLLAGVLTVATMVLLGIPFNFANVVVLPLLLGIGVDSGVHMVHRHREVSARRGGAPVGPHELLGTSTAQAVLFSALTTIASFGSLAFSDHRGFASLGQLLVIGVSFTLACNLIVLPALLAWRHAPRAGDLGADSRAVA